jgi:thiamine biosynthesis protein ThiS
MNSSAFALEPCRESAATSAFDLFEVNMERSVQVNGHLFDWEENLTVEKILQSVEVGHKMFIVKVDGVIIKKEHYKSKTVPEGARIRIFPLLSGG